MHKKAQSIGFTWVIALILLLVLGLTYVVFNQVMTIHVEPIADKLIDNSPYLNSTQIDDVKLENDKYMSFWHSLPFIIVALLVLFVLIAAIRGFN